MKPQTFAYQVSISNQRWNSMSWSQKAISKVILMASHYQQLLQTEYENIVASHDDLIRINYSSVDREDHNIHKILVLIVWASPYFCKNQPINLLQPSLRAQTLKLKRNNRNCVLKAQNKLWFDYIPVRCTISCYIFGKTKYDPILSWKWALW